MTYRYCELACGRNLPIRDGINWKEIELAVPCSEDGREINPASHQEDIKYWNKQVIGYEIKDKIIFVRLRGI